MSLPILVAAFDGLGRELHRRLAREPGNIVLSPLSIGLALAMTLSGARGATEAELQRVLGVAISRAEVEAASTDLVRKLEGYGQVDATHIAIANALLLDETYGELIAPSYQRLLKASYSAEIMTGATPAAVNAWVHDKTMGMIPHLLEDAGDFVAAMILNAMVFAAPWACPFDAEETRPGPFILADGDTIAVPMMRCHLHASVREGHDYRAIRIPFSASPLSFVCVVAEHATGLAAVAGAFDVGEAFEPAFTEMTLPKFRAEADLDLIPTLFEMGLRQTFGIGADFGGMTAAEPGLQIDKIRHAAQIDVHEAGCFAAAATTFSVAASGIERPTPEPFSVDRPFAFFIKDDRTGAVLIRGHIYDPRG